MGKKQYVFNKKIMLALILVYAILISATGQTAQTDFSNDILYVDINSLYGSDNPELSKNDCRNRQETTSRRNSVTTTGYLFDDCIFNTQTETAFLTYDHGGTKRLDYFDDKWTKFAGAGYHFIYAGAEFSMIDSGIDGELANDPGPSDNFYDKVVSWIKDTYFAWAAKDNYGSIRLILLSFGLIGLIGIRRKFKKR